MDLNYTRDTTSGDEGLDASRASARSTRTRRSCVMTAWGSIDLAVEAMRRGAQDFIEKPWDNERLLTVLRTQVALGQALQRTRALEAENRQLTRAGATELIAESAVMQPVLETIERVAPTDANVLITRRERHRQGPRRAAASTSARRAPRAQLRHRQHRQPRGNGVRERDVRPREGRVHGREGRPRRPFRARRRRHAVPRRDREHSGRAASAPAARARRTGEFERLGSSRTQQVDVRVLAATNADLSAEIEAGRFRGDLLFRLNTIQIHLPPLRERGEDIVRLAQAFLARARAAPPASGVRVFTMPALSALRRYAWPGNVRELEPCDRARGADGAAATSIGARGPAAHRRPAARSPARGQP